MASGIRTFADGSTVLPMTPAQDYKRVLDGDHGPNTGGMGAYSPLPWLPDGFVQEVVDTVALPVIRQLASEGRFPSRIEGVAVDVRDAERSGFIFRSSPSEINRRKPGLYQLLESMPARVDFKSPTDVFRITGDGIEFVDMATKTLDRAKSDAFTRVMKDKGFAFPARVIAGNASTRKDYDNGYFIVDNDFKVYHLKQMLRRPQKHQRRHPLL